MMSASHARGSRGIDQLSRFLNSTKQIGIAYRAHLDQVDPPSKQRLHGGQKTQVRVGPVRVRHVVELDEEIDVACCLVEVAPSGRTEHVQPADAVLLAQVCKRLTMAFEDVGHASLKLYHRRPNEQFLRRRRGRGGGRKGKARLAPSPTAGLGSRVARR